MARHDLYGATWTGLALLACTYACGPGEFEHDDGKRVVPPGAVTPTGTPTGTTGVEPLSAYETEMVGKWHRLHEGESDNYREYKIFHADRTGCSWREDIGSNVRDHACTYTYWSLNEEQPVGSEAFLIWYADNGGSSCWGTTPAESSDEYHFAPGDQEAIWKGGYSSLQLHPSTTEEVCE